VFQGDSPYVRELERVKAAFEQKCQEAAHLREELRRERSLNDVTAVRQGGRPWWQRLHLQQ
jgi:hypothetical protein